MSEEKPHQMAGVLIDHVPFANTLGMELLDVEAGKVKGRVKYKPEFAGDAESGIIHGGVVTALLDNLCGVSVSSSLTEPVAIATLDLRIDYMKPAEPGKDIIAECICYQKTRRIAFVRGVAHTGDESKPIAHCAGTFMLASSDKPPAHSGKIQDMIKAGKADQGARGGEG